MIQNWIKTNKLKAVYKNGLVDIEGVGKFYFIDREKVFDEKFQLEVEEDIDTDYYLYKFGSKYYYTKFGTEKNPELNILRYLGSCKQEIDDNFPYLGIHGGYELLNGSRSYEDWCKKAKFYGYDTLGICEHNTLAGILPFQFACKKKDIKPILGEEVTVKRNNVRFDIKLYVINETGWQNLLTIHKAIKIENEEFVDEDYLLENSEGLILVLNPDTLLTPNIVQEYKKAKFHSIYYQIDTVEWIDQERDLSYLRSIKSYLEYYKDIIPPILINDSYYLDKEDAYIKSILNTVAGRNIQYKSQDQYFKNLDDNYLAFYKMFEDINRWNDLFFECIDNLNKIKEDVQFTVITNKIFLPKFQSDKDNEELFWELIEEGLKNKLPNADKIHIDRITKEAEVITKGGFIDYFLILWDIIRWCKENGILTGVGRGSAAGSLISYLLDITKIDPLDYNLLFERFLNEGRMVGALPDVDIDIQSNRKDEVKEYIKSKYGNDYFCSVGTYTTFQVRAAIQDLGRVSGIDATTRNFITTRIDVREGQENEWKDIFNTAIEKKTIKDFVIKNSGLIEDIQLCLGQPKNTSVHASANVIVPKDKDIFHWMPIRKEENLLVSEWEGEFIEKAGFLKEDLLGLSQLDKFSFILDLIKKHYNQDIDIYNVPLDDKRVFDLFCDGYTADSFHFGSAGLTGYSKLVKPKNIEDLITMIALFRPGVMETGAHLHYISFREGRKDPEYDHLCEEITKKTFGLYVFQEQVMQACQILGGFSLIEADDIRKGMGKKIQSLLDSYKPKFIAGAVKNGCLEEDAIGIWKKLETFGGYGFNKCVSGKERFYHIGHNNTGRSTYRPRIEEMYKIKNDRKYAQLIGSYSLHQKYKYKGYGHCFSLNENGRLVKNKIKDIRLEGEQKIYRVTLEDGKYIEVTSMHKFPTINGEKRLKDINIENDFLYVNCGYEQLDSMYRWGTNFITPSSIGFLSQDTPYTCFLINSKILREKYKKCEICGDDKKLEIHHKDGNHGNSNIENLQVVCSSCHKKEHYKMGRTKVGEKGLLTDLRKIVEIKYIRTDFVYDVEVEGPYHNFCTERGIVTSNSHAASYAITGYISMWFKVNYPLEFWAAALQFVKKDIKVPRFIAEMNKIGSTQIVPPDVNNSDYSFVVDPKTNKIYWSLLQIKEVGQVATEVIIEARKEKGNFYSFEDFYKRVPKKKANKKVIEALIYSGAFDEIEGIKIPIQRKKIIEKYYEIGKVKIKDDEKNILLSEDINKKYWWVLKQKEISGLGYLDYYQIIKEYSKLNIKIDQYIDIIEFFEEISSVREDKLIAGIIVDYKEKNSKKGMFGEILLDINDEQIYCVLWSGIWEEFNEQIKTSKGKILVISGKVVFDDWKHTNVFQTEDSTIVDILE